MAIDFSKVTSKNPLAGGSTRQREVVGIRLDFTATTGQQTAEGRAQRTAAFVSRVQSRHAAERQIEELIGDQIKPMVEAQDRHAMSLAVIERSRVMRQHANGGDALYAEVERILALPLNT